MNLKKLLANVGVAAVVSAVTAAGISYALYRHGSPLEKAATSGRIDQIMHDYLTKNPEVLVEMTSELDKRQAADERRSRKRSSATMPTRSSGRRSPSSPATRTAMSAWSSSSITIAAIAAARSPTWSSSSMATARSASSSRSCRSSATNSEAAAKLALASIKQGKYFEMHQKLFFDPGKADKDKALRVAKELGLDIDKLQKDVDDPSVKQALEENKDLAQKLGLQGTPLYLIGDQVVPGVPDDLYGELRKTWPRSARKAAARPADACGKQRRVAVRGRLFARRNKSC